jgi:FtsZ-binding cell division protein ZapB
MSVLEQETDSLAGLEERIQKAVQLVTRLRQEKEAAQRDAAEARAQAAKMHEELEALRTERKHVRGRIEKLLGHIDQLGA